MAEKFHVLVTEEQNTKTSEMDSLTTIEMITLINEEDQLVAKAVQLIIPQIALAVDQIVARLSQGGRLIYIGAGTSGRLGVLDASECPPTFGTDAEMVQGIMAGGSRAVADAVEGAEDHEEWGRADLDERVVNAKDVIVGIAASGRTPYVIGAMKRGLEVGAAVIGISNNPNSAMGQYADIMLEAVVGPEAILGSTRMKAGTAQKMILNMLSSAAMTKLGKVYKNYMVDLHPSNEKLVARAKRTIQRVTDATDEQVNETFDEAGGNVKTAIVMLLADANRAEAALLLEQANGYVRKALELAHSALSGKELVDGHE